MEPVSFFSGISSGIDFRSLVDEIIRAKQQPADLMRARISGIETRSAAYAGLRDRVATFRDAAAALSDGKAFGGRTVSVSGYSVSAGSPLIATAAEGAPEGTYSVEVRQRATAEKLAGTDFATADQALALTGEFFVDGTKIDVFSTDSLLDIASRVRTATGSSGDAAGASVLSTGPDAHRLVFTASGVGAQGLDLKDGSGAILRQLGFLDATTSTKHLTSNGALSDGFSASDVGMSTTLGLVSIPPVSTITLGLGPAAFTVDVDLSSESLDQIAANINAAASGAGSGVTATVIQETSGPQAGFRLDIDGTTAFTDSNGVLEILGFLEGGRGAVAQEIEGAVQLQVGGGGNPASGGTKFKDLRINGQNVDASNGDTLTVNGTRGDGSAFSFTYTISTNDDLDDLLAALNDSVNGFQAGSRTATASLSANGEIVVTDDQGGPSQLALSIVSNNEGGGTLDFGAVSVSQAGREREIVAGKDALVNVNGALFQRSSNSIADAIPGVTLDIVNEAPGTTLTVEVDQNVGGSTEAVQALIDAYNGIVDYVKELSASVPEGQDPLPFSGNATVRSITNRLRRTMQTSLAPGAAGNLSRLGDVGIEIDREGRFTIDPIKFENEFTIDPVSVERLFAAYGDTTTSALRFLSGTDDTAPGSYTVDITQAAARASITGSGFKNAYKDDANPDTMTVTDLSSGGVFDISLADGMTMQQIVADLNAEFQSARTHQLTGSQSFFSDAGGTAAVATTSLDQLHDAGGSNLGVASGDTITISGTRSGGVAFSIDFTVVDASTQTLGDLMSQIDVQFGSDASVSAVNGAITADALAPGTSQISLTLTSDNAGGGSLNFGTFADTVVGRSAVDITASDVGGELRLEHGSYGLNQGFGIQLTANGGNGTNSLGLAAGNYAGLDVQGTIGGLAATGEGRVLTGVAGGATEGLAVEVASTGIGQLGDVSFSQGIAAIVENLADALTNGDDNSIDALAERGDATIKRLNERIDRFEDLLARRKEALLKKFVSLEEAFARSQSQSNFLLSTIGGVSFNGPTG